MGFVNKGFWYQVDLFVRRFVAIRHILVDTEMMGKATPRITNTENGERIH